MSVIDRLVAENQPYNEAVQVLSEAVIDGGKDTDQMLAVAQVYATLAVANEVRRLTAELGIGHQVRLAGAAAREPDPLAHVKAGDDAAAVREEFKDGVRRGGGGCRARSEPRPDCGYVCSRAEHPAGWQHIASDGDSVVHVWGVAR